MNKIYLLSFIFLIGIFGIGIGSAVECNADLSQGGDSCTVSSNLTLNGSYTLNFNGTTTGYLTFAGNNIFLDCNGTTIYGNSSGSNVGIYADNDNITIRNCGFRNYFRNMYLSGINITVDNVTVGASVNQGLFAIPLINSTIKNSIFRDATVGIYLTTGSSSNNISYNIFLNKSATQGINMVIGDHDIISFNNFTDVNYGFYGNVVGVGNYTQFFNNTCVNCLTDMAVFKGSHGLFFNNNGRNSANYLVYLASGTNNSVYNNVGNNMTIAGLDTGTNNNKIYNNSGNGGINYGFFMTGGSYSNEIYNNNFSNGAIDIQITNSRDNLVYNNYQYNCTLYQCAYDFNSNNTRWYNNVMDLNSKGITIGGSSNNISFFNNIVNNSINNYDGWNVGVLGYSSSGGSLYSLIYNNTLDNIGCEGILVQKGSGWNITGNTINLISRQNALSKKVNCGYELQTGISLNPVYKTWLGDSTESFSDTLANKIIDYNVTNFVIKGNTINGFDVLLRMGGVTNVSYDITGEFFSHQNPDYIVPRDDMILRNNWNNLSTTTTNGIEITNLRQGYKGVYQINYTIFRDFHFYHNLNSTNKNILRNNLTNFLVFNTNGSIYGNSNINLNDGNINITLTPNNSSYVLDNFNLTEGISRQHSPIWFSSSSSTQKHIASNLSESVNVSVTITGVDCERAGTIDYKSNTGIQTKTFGVGEYTCSEGVITFDSLLIEPATNSNEITINYDIAKLDLCTGALGGLTEFATWFIILIVVIAGGFVVFLLLGGDVDISDSEDMVGIVVIAGVIITIGGVIISNVVGNIC